MAKQPELSAEQREDISAALLSYGARLTEDGRIAKGDKVMSVRLTVKAGRLRMEGAGSILASYPASRIDRGISSFVESFWYWKKSPARLDAEIAEVLMSKVD